MNMAKYIGISRRDMMIFLIGTLFGVVVSHIFILTIVVGGIVGYLAYPYLRDFASSVGRVMRI
jgi:hypothetical protein